MIDLVGSDSGILRIPYEEAYEAGFEDMMRRIPDTSKINQAIGWQARHSLDEILEDIIAHERGIVPTVDHVPDSV